MEGYLIRVPREACVPDDRPAWRRQRENYGPVGARVLYYVLEEGYLRGYESPEDFDHPVESFQLTSHRIDVNAMYAMNLFEISAHAVKLPSPPQADDTSSSSSSASDSDSDGATDHARANQSYGAPTAVASSGTKLTSGSFRVVFFAANKELVKTWCVKLLNWNRYVFDSVSDLNSRALKLAEDEVVDAFQSIIASNAFLRQVELQKSQEAPQLTDNPASIPPPPPPIEQLSSSPPIDRADIPTPIEGMSTPTLIEQASIPPLATPTDIGIVVKPTDPPMQPQQTAWWMTPFTRSRRISSFSLRR
ncbi:hypothetical protein BBJ28_00011922 [Nothophytophthora sp. Chile5]|nr:hypothetical protein BBJ28_00011922 [Nothophytophthora sp. Chile5]